MRQLPICRPRCHDAHIPRGLSSSGHLLLQVKNHGVSRICSAGFLLIPRESHVRSGHFSCDSLSRASNIPEFPDSVTSIAPRHGKFRRSAPCEMDPHPPNTLHSESHGFRFFVLFWNWILSVLFELFPPAGEVIIQRGFGLSIPAGKQVMAELLVVPTRAINLLFVREQSEQHLITYFLD